MANYPFARIPLLDDIDGISTDEMHTSLSSGTGAQEGYLHVGGIEAHSKRPLLSCQSTPLLSWEGRRVHGGGCGGCTGWRSWSWPWRPSTSSDGRRLCGTLVRMRAARVSAPCSSSGRDRIIQIRCLLQAQAQRSSTGSRGAKVARTTYLCLGGAIWSTDVACSNRRRSLSQTARSSSYGCDVRIRAPSGDGRIHCNGHGDGLPLTKHGR